MLFGLACEGITDQITIENILCGYFENTNLDEDITKLQPFLMKPIKNKKNLAVGKCCVRI